MADYPFELVPALGKTRTGAIRVTDGVTPTQEGMKAKVCQILGSRMVIVAYIPSDGVWMWRAEAEMEQDPINAAMTKRILKSVPNMVEIRGPVLVFREKFWTDNE